MKLLQLKTTHTYTILHIFLVGIALMKFLRTQRNLVTHFISKPWEDLVATGFKMMISHVAIVVKRDKMKEAYL